MLAWPGARRLKEDETIHALARRRIFSRIGEFPLAFRVSTAVLPLGSLVFLCPVFRFGAPDLEL